MYKTLIFLLFCRIVRWLERSNPRVKSCLNIIIGKVMDNIRTSLLIIRLKVNSKYFQFLN